MVEISKSDWKRFRALVPGCEADRGCKQFGAGAHRYRRNPPASAAEVEKFERETGVRMSIPFSRKVLKTFRQAPQE